MEMMMNNDLPNTQVLLEYLDLYPRAREAYRKTLVNQAKYNVEKLASFFTAHDPVDDRLDSIVNNMKTDISKALTFERMFDLIFKLRLEAEKAQSLKTKYDESLLSETLHAIADLIVCELSTNDKYIKIVADLQKDKIARADDINACIVKYQGNNINKANEEYTKVILKLADLGDIVSINEVLERKENLHQLKRPVPADLARLDCLRQPPVNAGNLAAPLSLQPKFCEWLYAKEFQAFTQISFKEFKETAILHGEQEKMEAQLRAEQLAAETSTNTALQLMSVKQPVSNDNVNQAPTSLASNSVFATTLVKSPSSRVDTDINVANDVTTPTASPVATR